MCPCFQKPQRLQRHLWRVWGDGRVSHLAGQDEAGKGVWAESGEGLASSGSGANMLKAGPAWAGAGVRLGRAGLQEAWSGSLPSCPLGWGCQPWGCVPSVGSGEGLGLRACPQLWPWGDSAPWGAVGIMDDYEPLASTSG